MASLFRNPLAALALGTSLAACAASHRGPTSASYVRAQAAPETQPPTPVVAAVPPLPLQMPGQMKPMPPTRGSPNAASKRAAAPPQQVVSDANKRAAQAPDPSGYFNAIVQYGYEPGTLYQVFAAPMRITDLALEPGEHIVGQPACGDTVRWVLAEGKSLQDGVEQWHVYLKPTRPGLETNLAINTDRHSYMLELHSYDETYMAVVTWRFPQEERAKLQAEAAALTAQERDSSPVVGLNSLNFNYAIQVIKGKPVWTPVQVFDDGRKTFVRFPQTMLVREAPALFVLRDKETQLVNYRMKNDFYVIDRLIDSAELRVGGKDAEEIVRVFRSDPSR
jgi:type IV secretion system protein VirB9